MSDRDDRDDDAHEARELETGRCEPEDPYRWAPLGSPFSDD